MSGRRLLIVSGSLGPGGTELAVAALARGLARRARWAPRVAVLGEGGEHAAALRDEGVPVDELRVPSPYRRPAALRALLQIPSIVRREKVSVVQTFLFDADFYGLLAARLAGRRVFLTTRRAIKRRRPHHIRGYRMTNWLAHRIVCNSEAVRAFTLEAERVRPEKVLVVPNGARLEHFGSGDRARLRARFGAGEDDLLVGALGTIKEVKGQRVLLEAMLPLLAENPRLRLVLAGEVTKGYGEELARVVAESGLRERVALPGVMREVPDLLAALDLFVLPSLSEGMSNALVEAMAAGKAIVATTVGGNGECLAWGDAGLLVPPNDPRALAAGISEVLAEPERRAALSARARARAEQEYSIDRMLERYEALYESLTEGRG